MNKIIKNFGVLFVGNSISKIIGFFSLILTTRYLGVENFGILSFGIAFVGMFNVLFTLGLNPLLTREISRNKAIASKYLGNVITIKLFLAGVIFCLIFIIMKIIGFNEIKVKIVYIITLSTIFTSFSETFYSIFQAYEKMEYQAISQVLSSILMLSGVYVATKCNFNIVNFAFLYVYVNFLVLFYVLITCKNKFTPFTLKLDIKFMKEVFKLAIPFAVSAFILNFYTRIDITMLSYMHGDKAVGYYSSAWRLIEIFTTIPAIYSTALFPAMSFYYVSSMEDLKNLYKNSFRLLFLLVIAIQIFVIVFADFLIPFLYGKEFTYAIKVIQILIWVLFPIFFNFLLGNLIAAINRQEMTVIFSFIGLLFNVFLNIILIPPFSYIGASISTLVTQFFLFCFLYAFLNKNNFKIPLVQTIGKPLAVSIFVGGIMAFLKQKNLFLAFFLGLTLYITLVLLFEIVKKEEMKSIFATIFKK